MEINTQSSHEYGVIKFKGSAFILKPFLPFSGSNLSLKVGLTIAYILLIDRWDTIMKSEVDIFPILNKGF